MIDIFGDFVSVSLLQSLSRCVTDVAVLYVHHRSSLFEATDGPALSCQRVDIFSSTRKSYLVWQRSTVAYCIILRVELDDETGRKGSVYHHHRKRSTALLAFRCDIEAVLPDGGTGPLHIACRRGFERAATLLLDCNANHAAPGPDGHSALHMAAKEGKAAIVEVRPEGSSLLNGNVCDVCLSIVF